MRTLVVDGVGIHPKVLDQVPAHRQLPRAGGEVQRARAALPHGLHRLRGAAPPSVQRPHHPCKKGQIIKHAAPAEQHQNRNRGGVEHARLRKPRSPSDAASRSISCRGERGTGLDGGGRRRLPRAGGGTRESDAIVRLPPLDDR